MRIVERENFYGFVKSLDITHEGLSVETDASQAVGESVPTISPSGFGETEPLDQASFESKSEGRTVEILRTRDPGADCRSIERAPSSNRTGQHCP